MLTTKDVADRYGVTPATVGRWCQKGYLPGARRVGGKMRGVWIIPASALDGFEPPKPGRPKETD